MGNIAEMMIDGTLCECCGELMDDMESPGYPRRCPACEVETPLKPKKKQLNKKKKPLKKTATNH